MGAESRSLRLDLAWWPSEPRVVVALGLIHVYVESRMRDIKIVREAIFAAVMISWFCFCCWEGLCIICIQHSNSFIRDILFRTSRINEVTDTCAMIQSTHALNFK